MSLHNLNLTAQNADNFIKNLLDGILYLDIFSLQIWDNHIHYEVFLVDIVKEI